MSIAFDAHHQATSRLPDPGADTALGTALGTEAGTEVGTEAGTGTATRQPARPGLEAPLFLAPADIVTLIRQRGAAAVIAGIAEAIGEDFRRWPDFDKSARIGSHCDEGVIELMPIADRERFACKYVNGHPGNPARGLSTVMAFGVLADMRTGRPLLLSELTLTTALRTAAMSALAARELARPDCRTLALIGNGAQAAFQAIAFASLVGIQTFRLHDIDPAATARLVEHLDREGLDWIRCQSAAEACEGADIITTITADKALATIVSDAMVRPGVHLNAVGGDCPGKCELDPAILSRAQVFVEFEPQTRIEGEIQRLPADFPVTEFWRVLTGAAGGRRDREAITVFDSVGFALEDYSALRYLLAAATDLGLGRPLPVLPVLDDPKDLYGVVAAD